MLIDSHCHLDFESFQPIEQYLQQAKSAGVELMITIGGSDNFDSADRCVALAENHHALYASVGVHPHDASCFGDDGYQRLETVAKHPKVVAIGETGLDYYYDHSPRELQQSVFKEQLKLAAKLNIPAVIHTRDAEDDTIAILTEMKQQYPELKIVIHCFSGTQKLANAALELGAMISFSGIITFKKSDDLRKIVATIPVERMMVETDAPFLTPTPFRGKQNQPAYVTYVADTIATIKEIPREKLDQQLTNNTLNFFGITI